uniref:Ankyrin repeat and death domain containing protein n=1 Tax=Echinococcus granulosus TaxID=6210 RepID=A0A068WXQ1_ECHGR|nr:ankyrin repeat and death domain containing protein [Echinococcus granulosus]
MPTATNKAGAGGEEHEKRKMTYTSEKFQKLIHRKEEGQDGAPTRDSRLGLGEGERKHRRMTLNSEILHKIRHKKDEGQNGRNSSKEMQKTDPRRALMLDLPQEATVVESGPVKNPDEDCEMVTALDTDNLTKVQFQFLEAARTNRCDILGMIIEQRACRLDLKNNLDRTALHLAAAQGCFEAVQMLVNANASVDIPDKHGMTPMFWAAYKDFIDIVIYLIRHGASIQRKTKRGFTLLHVLAKADSIKTLEALVRSKIIRNFKELDLNDCTPLMVATISGSLRATTVLSRIGNLETHVDKTKKNVFHLAVLGGCHLVLEQLCKHEEMPSLINAFDDDLKAPIHYAIDLDDYDSVSVLLKYGARANIKSKNAPYPLITASRRGNVDMINLLLNNKARISAADFAGNTPLHISCIANQVDAAWFLLQKGANMLALNKRLQTPFNAAVEQASAETAELLILAGAPINEVDRAAKKPLMQAALSGFVRIVDMIIKADRWRLASPAAAAAMAKKYNPKKRTEDGEENLEAGKEDVEVEKASANNHEYEEFEETDSISEASTYVSKSSTSDSEGKESDSKVEASDDDSLSHAETYHSESEGDRDVTPAEYSAKASDEVFTSPRQYRKAESVFSSSSATGSARGRRIERSKQQKAAATLNEDHVYQMAPSLDGCNGGGNIASPAPKLSRGQSTLLPSLQQDGGSVASKPPLRSGGAGVSKVPNSLRRSPVALTAYFTVYQPEYRFLVSTQSYAGRYQTLFFYLAHKKLRRGEWKSLAKHWDFTEEQIEAIELQHTGDRQAYKEHGYRLLCIWMHGLSEETDPAPMLYKALTSIGRKMDANNVQKDFYRATHGRHSVSDYCPIS